MVDEMVKPVVERCSFCNRARIDTACMCYGINENIAICNFCIGACLKAVGNNLLDNIWCKKKTDLKD